jgi:4-carboxymuconolactone decarboxylase
MNRLPQLNEAALTAQQQRVFDQIALGPRGQVVGPLRVWLQNPKFAEKAQALGQYARYETGLPEQLSELAILVTARCWSSGFEWVHHAPLALGAGVPVAAIDAISKAQKFTFDNKQMQAVFDMAVELHRDRKIGDETYAAAIGILGLNACVDLVGICGYYTLISMTINVFDVPAGDVPDGDGPVLAQLDLPLDAYFRR